MILQYLIADLVHVNAVTITGGKQGNDHMYQGTAADIWEYPTCLGSEKVARHKVRSGNCDLVYRIHAYTLIYMYIGT